MAALEVSFQAIKSNYFHRPWSGGRRPDSEGVPLAQPSKSVKPEPYHAPAHNMVMYQPNFALERPGENPGETLSRLPPACPLCYATSRCPSA